MYHATKNSVLSCIEYALFCSGDISFQIFTPMIREQPFNMGGVGKFGQLLKKL